jgi:hypothetical protein
MYYWIPIWERKRHTKKFFNNLNNNCITLFSQFIISDKLNIFNIFVFYEKLIVWSVFDTKNKKFFLFLKKNVFFVFIEIIIQV